MVIQTKLLPPRYLLRLVLGTISATAPPIVFAVTHTGCFKKVHMQRKLIHDLIAGDSAFLNITLLM